MTFGLFESFERLFRFDVKNTSGEIIPPYACMELDYSLESGKSALEIDNSTLVVLVKKPTADNLGSPERFLINGPMAIAIDGFGSAYKLPIMQALMDIATPPSPGDTVGPSQDSWLLASSGSGWKVKSLDPSEAYVDGDTATVFVEVVGNAEGLAYFWPPSGGIPAATYNTTTDTLSTGAAVCTRATKAATGVYEQGSSSDTVENITSFTVGASGRPMACARNAYGRWTVVVEDCGSTPSTGGGTTPLPDVGEKGSSSRSIDMGYSLGV